MATSSISSSSSDSSSSIWSTPPSSVPSSPTKRKQEPKCIRLCQAPDAVNDFSSLKGKKVIGVKRSPIHPNVVLHLSDKTSFQIKVDGYNPQFPGISKEIELNSACEAVFPERGGYSQVELTIDNCASVSMLDSAFDARGGHQSSWKQSHLGIAFKFLERPGWHCMWAMLAENEPHGDCVFRSFEDVYLARSQPQARRGSKPKKPFRV